MPIKTLDQLRLEYEAARVRADLAKAEEFAAFRVWSNANFAAHPKATSKPRRQYVKDPATGRHVWKEA